MIIEIEQWDGTVDVGPDSAIQSVHLDADLSSLQVREGQRRQGAYARKAIRTSIDEKVLRGKPIALTSPAVEPRDGGAIVRGELTMAKTTRSAAFDIDVSGDGRVAETLPVTESEQAHFGFEGTESGPSDLRASA